MNIYEKLAQARVDFHSAKIKKSGWNDYSQYEYFELSDFLPVILKLQDKHKFICMTSFDENLATMEIIDLEKTEDKIIFTSPMSTAKLKACHEVQNLGAVETYERRYLYMTAFEIIENDEVDRSLSYDNAVPQKKEPKKNRWEKEQLDSFAEIMQNPLFTEDRKAFYRTSIKNGVDYNSLKKEAEEEVQKMLEDIENTDIF